MPKPTDMRVMQASASTRAIAYRSPMKFGGRVVRRAVLLDVQVEIETRTGKRGEGKGSMPMSNVWAWPSASVPGTQAEEVMIALGTRFAAATAVHSTWGHPLEITHELGRMRSALAAELPAESALAEPVPLLAELVAASPTQAAIHDAFGRALGANSYDLLGPQYANRDLSYFLTPQFAGEYLDQYTLRKPKPRMPLYHLVGALDPLTTADLTERLDDGLPETLSEWIDRDGLTHLKIKLNGDDLSWDVERVVAVDHVATETQARRGVSDWWYSCDFNERCPNVEYLLEFFRRIQEMAPAAWDRIQYIEQPTHRDLAAHPENRVHAAARLKPIVIDESLVDFESLQLSRELGYSGVALKTCKGHSDALVMGAAAQKYGLFLCVQDLTCPGASFLHSASLAARIPTVAAVEGNARQYCPAGNQGWEEKYPGMFRIENGLLQTEALHGPGLGFA